MANILIISSTPFFGGAEQFIINTLTKLEIVHNVNYIVRCKELADKLPHNKTAIFKSSSIFKQIKEIKQSAKIIKADILLFNGSNIAYSLPVFKKHKTIYYRHTTNLYVPKPRRWLFEIIMNCLYRNANLTIHVSKYSLSEQKKGKGIYIHNGIVPVSEKIESNGRIEPLKVLFCSRLEKAKGIHEIITAFKQIKPATAHLTIIGTGNEKNWVEQNVCGNIKYLGFQKEVSKFYQEADVMILMSEFENFPISVIEAMSYGLPIITTGAGGISEMVKDYYNGLIITSDTSEIINAVNLLNSDRKLLKNMGENSRDFCIQHLNLNDKVEEIHQAIESVLNNENRDRL